MKESLELESLEMSLWSESSVGDGGESSPDISKSLEEMRRLLSTDRYC
jgi:hypothetical protein